MMILRRTEKSSDGIFGQLLTSGNTVPFCLTLEHAYTDPSGVIFSKIPKGLYLCIRGQHRLEGMHESFMTYQITGVPNHTKCLFHVGNTQKDVDGCVAVGLSRDAYALTESRKAFEKFMSLLRASLTFYLTVEDKYP